MVSSSQQQQHTTPPFSPTQAHDVGSPCSQNTRPDLAVEVCPARGWSGRGSVSIRRGSLSSGRGRGEKTFPWCSWTCSSTTAADDGCTRRITPSSELGARKTTSRERERESGALLGVTLCGAPPRRENRERERLVEPTDRPIDHRLLNVLTSFVLFCFLQRGRGQDEVIVQAFSVPSVGFQGSPSGGRLLGVPRCCVEGEDHPWLRDCDTAVWFRAFFIVLAVL